MDELEDLLRRLEASISLLESAMSGLRKVQVELAAYIAEKNVTSEEEKR